MGPRVSQQGRSCRIILVFQERCIPTLGNHALVLNKAHAPSALLLKRPCRLIHGAWVGGRESPGEGQLGGAVSKKRQKAALKGL